MRLVILTVLVPVALFSQGERSNRPQITPSQGVTTPLPEQDITITIHITSDQATALEKRRRDLFIQVTNPDGSTTLAPRMPSLPDQIVFDLGQYFSGLIQRYPSDSLKEAQAAQAAAQKALQDAADKAGKVERKK